MVLLSCEGAETSGMNQQAMHEYATAGGRIFASHYHYAWFNSGPYAGENLARWTPGAMGSDDIGDITASIVTSFPKGKALSDWLGNVSALTGGRLAIQQARHNADVGAANKPSQSWIVADNGAAGATEYFSFETPTNAAPTDAGVPNYCGRVVYSDLHVGAASNDYSGGFDAVVPSGCSTGELSPQEKALEFMLFDLSSCVTPDTAPPIPPVQ
jgi:hypothetical protein